MRRISSPQLTNIGTSFAVAGLIVIGAYNGLVAPTFNWVVGGIVVFGLVAILPGIALLREHHPVRQTAWAYFFASHSLSFLALVYIAGMDNPFTALWVVMLVISYLELGKKAFLMSALSLAAALAIGRQITPEIAPEQRFSLTIVGVVIASFLTVFAWVIARIALNERNARRDLEKTRVQEREQFHKLETVMNSLGDTVLTIDRDGLVTAQNAAAMILFDTNRSLVGENIEDILPLEMTDGGLLTYKDVLNQGLEVDRDDIVRKAEDGEIMRLQVQLRPVRTSYVENNIADPGYIVIVRDITKQKTLEQERDEFISVASHELRTPIAIMEAGLANLLVMQDKGLKSDDIRKYTEDAHQQTIQLGRIVNDLSTVIKAEQQAFSSTAVHLNDTLRAVCDAFVPKMNQAHLDFNTIFDSNIQDVRTDRGYLEEVVRNLLDNALKYTKSGSVALETHDQEPFVVIKVKDTGVGIARTDQEKIFEKFYRVEDFHTRETGGTGLGLYIAKKLVEKMGGSIEVESHLGQGATFSVMLPKSANK